MNNEEYKAKKQSLQKFFESGNLHYQSKEYQKAIADHTKAIQLDPNCAIAYYVRAVSYDNLKEYQKAIADCNKAIELNPSDAEVDDIRSLIKTLRKLLK